MKILNTIGAKANIRAKGDVQAAKNGAIFGCLKGNRTPISPLAERYARQAACAGSLSHLAAAA